MKPPAESMSVAICSADLVVVPWLRSVATKLATPGRSAGSWIAPARTSSRKTTDGCS
jgi:hypothetical protein